MYTFTPLYTPAPHAGGKRTLFRTNVESCGKIANTDEKQ